MRFATPGILLLLLLVPGFLAAAWIHAAFRRRALERFAGGRELVPRFAEQVSPHRRAARAILMCVALAGGVVAAARPQWGTRLDPVTRKGVDVVVAVDSSSSMSAQDVAPSRLAAAKHAADSLFRKLAGNRVGLVSFAGKATLSCPLTLDADAARLFLDGVDVEAVPVKGTSLADAVRVALRAFRTGGAGLPTERGRVLIVLSDGEDHEGGLDEAVASLRKDNVKVFAVGFGTRAGAPIPLGEGTGAGYKKDAAGRVVTSRLDDSPMSKLTLDTGGRYFDATAAELEADEIARAVGAMDATELGTLMRTRYEERFQLPLGVALAALLGGSLLGDRRRGAGRETPGTEAAR